MANQLVGQRAAHSFKQQRIVGVLEDGPVPLLLDVLQILTRGAIGRILLAHVAKPAGELGQALAIGALAQPVNLEMIRFQEDRTRQ